jgi:NAD(P)-dependent dehydrogenase (short-subunit alcohol dehydrogenase family)
MGEPLAGKVAWVAGVGEGAGDLLRGVGRASALLLAARGARVLVSGPDERALGACVGEIAHGGGQARHIVTELRTSVDARASVEAARERFGRLDLAVIASAGSLEGVARAFDAARDAIQRGGRLVLVAQGGEERVPAFVQEVARVFAPRGITCNAVLLGAVPVAIRTAEAEDVAELVLSLASRTGEAISGATLMLS